MSEYKRWISYIYNYERGIKSVNAGYVRIESRNGKCRMTVNIKGGVAMGDRLTMYLFYRDGLDMIMVYAGEGEFYNGICEFSAQTLVDNVFGSGMNINEMCGVIAYSTMDRFYGTEWDDKPIVLRKIIEHNTYILKEEKENVVSFVDEPQFVVSAADEVEEVVMGEISSQIKEQISQIQMDEEDTYHGPKEGTDNSESMNINQDSIENNAENNISENNNTENKDLEKDEDSVIMDVPMSGALSRIFSKMPGMYPFEDDDIMECVKFEPQDIGVFPMDKWVLANNSFLLHGYYTYRHLIFARRRTKEGPRCMLGVPGLFRDREKFMAGMFGFGNFKSIRGKKTPGYGEFGYWYMDIDMK